MVGQNRDDTLVILRWSARILGSALFLFFVSCIVFGRIEPIWNQSIEVQIGFLGVFLFLLGCLAGWNRDGVGAFLVFVGYLIYKIVEGQGSWPPATVELVLVTAVLYFIAWWRSATKAAKA